MGYVNDTTMSQWFSPSACHYVTGTWSDAAGNVANTIVKAKAAADNTGVITIPIALPSNSAAYKGCCLKSVDVYWEVTTADMDAVTAAIYKVTLPANGAAIGTVESLSFSYDSGHDTAGERLTADQHTMTLTLTTPEWLDNDEVIQVKITADAAATSVFHFIGARANFELRI